MQSQIKGSLPKNFVYYLGKPSTLLLNAGIENLPIELKANKLAEKSKQKEHVFALNLLFDMAKNLHSPIMIFKSSTVANTFLVLLENTKNHKNFVAVIRKNKNQSSIEINDIRSIYPRDYKQVLTAIIEKYLLWVDKEKALNFLDKQRFNSAEVIQNLKGYATKIIQNFENTKGDVSNNLGGLEPITAIMSNAEIIALQEKGQLGTWLQGYEPKEYAIVLRGDKGAGKSRLLHQLINLFAGSENKKTAFYSLEIDKNTGIAQKMKAEYFTPSALVNIDCTSATTSIEDLKKVAASGIYQCVAIDSFNKIQNISQKDFEILRKSYPNIIWLVIFQSTTGKVIRGGNMPEYDCSVVIQVNKGGFAIQEKNRYGNTDKTYSVFEQKIVEQDKI